MVTSPPFSQFNRRWHGWPAPLSSRINHLLWISLIISTSIPTTFAIRHLHLHSRPTKPAAGCENLGVALGIVAALYSAFLLILSRKERKLTIITAEEDMDWEDIEDTTYTARMRSTLSLLMVAVCQSFLAALFLYVGVRLIFLLRAPSATHYATAAQLVYAYGDFGLVVGQMGLMGYVVFRAVLHEARIEGYLTMQEFRERGEMPISMVEKN